MKIPLLLIYTLTLLLVGFAMGIATTNEEVRVHKAIAASAATALRAESALVLWHQHLAQQCLNPKAFAL